LGLIFARKNDHSHVDYMDDASWRDVSINGWTWKISEMRTKLGVEGCVLTAFSNAIRNLGVQVNGQNSNPKILFDFLKANGAMGRDGGMDVGKLSLLLPIDIYQIPSNLEDPTFLNKFLEKGCEIVMSIPSPKRFSLASHCVNLSEVTVEKGVPYVYYKETKLDFHQNYPSKIEYSKVQKSHLVAHNNFPLDKSTKVHGKGEEPEFKECFSKLTKNGGFRVGNTIGFAVGNSIGDLIDGKKDLKTCAKDTAINLTIGAVVNKLVPAPLLAVGAACSIGSTFLRKDLTTKEKVKVASKQTLEIGSGIGASLGGMYLGASIGASFGVVGGPIGFAIGAAGGVVGGLVCYGAKRLLGWLFG